MSNLFTLRWPSQYPRVTQPFNWPPTRENYTPFGLAGHEGLDLQAPHGSLISACADGEVYRVEQQPLAGDAYGVQVRIRHTWRGIEYKTVYAHLVPDSVVVRVGEWVYAGQVIGRSDNTGNSSGSHLHLTLKKTGATAAGETDFPNDIVDPTPYLAWPGLCLRMTAPTLLRAAASAGAAPIVSLRPGQMLMPRENHADVLAKAYYGPAWLYVETEASLTGWVLAEAVEVVAEPSPDPSVRPPLPPLHRRERAHLVGLHVAPPGDMAGYVDAFLKPLAEAGMPAACVFSTGEGGVLFDAQVHSPETVRVFRTKAGGDTPETNWGENGGDFEEIVDAYLDAQMAVWALNPWAQLYALLNEPHPKTADQIAWCDRMMVRGIQRAANAGYRVVGFNWSVLAPEIDVLQRLSESLRLLYDAGGAFGYHPYGLWAGGGDGTLMGSRHAMDHLARIHAGVFVPLGLPDFPVILSEFAPSPPDGGTWESRGREAFVDDLVRAAGYIRDELAHVNVIGVCAFTVGDGGGEWAGWNFAPAFPLLAERIIKERG